MTNNTVCIVPIPPAAAEIKQTPFDFRWTRVNYAVEVTVGKEKKTKQLLENMNGKVNSNEVLAVMGGSGAGKSTFLATVSGRLAGGSLSGDIRLAGEPRDKRTWLQDYSFVEQDDLLHSNLTVQETLQFAARFRLPAATPAYIIKERVDEIIMDLGLNGCRNTVIGGGGVKGISGGMYISMTLSTN